MLYCRPSRGSLFGCLVYPRGGRVVVGYRDSGIACWTCNHAEPSPADHDRTPASAATPIGVRGASAQRRIRRTSALSTMAVLQAELTEDQAQSKHSSRTVRTQRPAYEFATGGPHRGGEHLGAHCAAAEIRVMVRTSNQNRPASSQRSASRFRPRWVTQAPVEGAVTPANRTRRRSTSRTDQLPLRRRKCRTAWLNSSGASMLHT
jgi:hypothetical protein